MFNIVFTGKIRDGVDRDQLVRDFCNKFQYDEATFREKLESGYSLVLKKNVDRKSADGVVDMLTEMGLEVEAQPVEVDDLEKVPGQQDSQHPSESLAHNPYQRVARQHEEPQAEFAPQEPGPDVKFGGARNVDTGRGVNWLTEGYSRYVSKDFGGWIGAIVVLILIYIVLGFIPLIGSLAANLLAPVFTAGLMLGAQGQDRGEGFSVNCLFSAFGDATSKLVLVGVIYMGAILAIILVSLMLVGGSMAAFGGFGGDESAVSMFNNPGAYLLPLLVVALLIVPMAMAFWFAPALIILNGMSTTDAMKESFGGCLKNIMPFLVYGLVVLVLSFIAAIPLMLGYLILIPVVSASMYVGYKDIFCGDN
jgi:hypothetical protein